MSRFFGLYQGAITANVVQLPQPLAHWKLNGNGNNEVATGALTLSGSPETGVAPLIADGGTSIGFDGADDKGVAAHHASWEVPNWTIVATLQPDSAPTSGQRCIVGKGTFATDEFQIEQRVGQGRAYTSDGTTVHFCDPPGGGSGSGGVVPLPNSVACQLALIGRDSGVELRHRPAGGSWSLVGSHGFPQALGRSASDLFVGGSPYGGAFFDGPIDDVRIYAVGLSAEQLDLLPAPQTIDHSIGEPPPVEGDELTVPSLAEFLKSDEADPAVTKYVSNINRGSGTGSSPGNAQALATALSGAVAGNTFLAVCQTPGTIEYWNLTSGISFPSGTAGNPITLQARQGDGVVISAAESFAGARTPNSGFWTQNNLSQADVDKGIWKSTQSFGSESATVLGVWVEFDHPHYLVPYGSIAKLQAPYNGIRNCPPNSASGPGVHLDNGTLYIRWIRPHPTKYSGGNKWQSHLWPGHPEAVSGGRIVYPISLDPNDYVMNIYRTTSTMAFNMSAGNGGGFVKIGSGINSLGFRQCIHGHDITMRRGLDICWRWYLQNSSSAGIFNFDVQRRRMTHGSVRHISRDDFKFHDVSSGLTGWLENSFRQAFIEMHHTVTFSMYNLNFKDCVLSDWHEWGVARFHEWRFRNCTFFNGVDDGFQVAPESYRFELGYCLFLNAAIGGNGGTDGSAGNKGQIYVHHNVIDCRIQKGSSFINDTFPQFVWLNHSSEGSSPRKQYNNTVMWGPDVEDLQPDGFNHNSNNDNTATGTTAAHETFNNIFIRHDSQRYIPTSIGSASTAHRSDFVGMVVSCSPNESNELWDYNLYYRDVPLISGSFTHNLLHRWRAGKGVSEQGFATLAAFRASALFTTSKASGSLRGAYSPGFEANGTDAKPTLPSLDSFPADRFKYRPSATSAVTTAASSSLSGANWWSGLGPSWGRSYFPWNDGAMTLAPGAWKGALDPNGDTLPIGVQNP